jgi:hypothetical protein
MRICIFLALFMGISAYVEAPRGPFVPSLRGGRGTWGLGIEVVLQSHRNLQSSCKMADLSEYELVRLDNIARNEEFLRSIGMNEVTNSINSQAQALTKAKSGASARGVSRRAAGGSTGNANAIPARRSSRVTLERLKNEDFSLLSSEEREKKEEELRKMQADKLGG